MLPHKRADELDELLLETRFVERADRLTDKAFRNLEKVLF